jgi:hypothetical protein
MCISWTHYSWRKIGKNRSFSIGVMMKIKGTNSKTTPYTIIIGVMMKILMQDSKNHNNGI